MRRLSSSLRSPGSAVGGDDELMKKSSDEFDEQLTDLEYEESAWRRTMFDRNRARKHDLPCIISRSISSSANMIRPSINTKTTITALNSLWFSTCHIRSEKLREAVERDSHHVPALRLATYLWLSSSAISKPEPNPQIELSEPRIRCSLLHTESAVDI